MMSSPPFKLAATSASAHSAGPQLQPACCEDDSGDLCDGVEAPGGRARLTQLNTHFHCSVLGTCLGTAELRKVAARFIDVQDCSDLDVHHEAVRLAADGPLARALQKTLDQRHAAVIGRFAKVRGSAGLLALWKESLALGEVPGAYWAVLTHRDATTELRNAAFGDVHMLSHLVGAANRADIRRLVALEQENTSLRERLDQQLLRSQETAAAQDHALSQLQKSLADAQGSLVAARTDATAGEEAVRPGADVADLVAIHTQRREQAERTAAVVREELARLQQDVAQWHSHAATLGRELAAAEIQLRELSDPEEQGASHLDAQLRGRRILYVGGRPSSTPAIRGLVIRHGGEFNRHGGGLEDRKGLLASAVASADLVVFPVDCIDHDSAGTLKRLCVRQGKPFIPMRRASVASFAAAMSGQVGEAA